VSLPADTRGMPKFDPWSRDLERVRQLCAELGYHRVIQLLREVMYQRRDSRRAAMRPTTPSSTPTAIKPSRKS